MLMLFSVRAGERSPARERAVHSVYSGCLSLKFINLCVLLDAYGFKNGMWDLIVLIQDQFLSFFFIYRQQKVKEDSFSKCYRQEYGVKNVQKEKEKNRCMNDL